MQPRDLPLFNALYHVPVMMLEPTIRLGLAMRAGPLCQTEFAYKQGDEWVPGIEADDPTIGDFVERNLKRIWDLHIGGLLDAQKWGWAAAEVVLKETSAGFIEIAELLHRQAQDVRPLTRNGKVAGVRFLRIEDAENGRVDLEYPYCLWHPFRPEPGQYFGVSICKGAFSPFWDKWMDGGALDVRRLFMHKDAYGGVDVSYPDGFTEIPITTGSLETRSTPNANIAREMAEQIKAGGVTTRPAQYDQSGKELWTVTRATVPANPAHILTYPKDLDTEMTRGLEIPDDVLESTEGSGGAWAGKTVPQGAFYTGLELWRTGLFGDIKPVLDYLVRLNFSGRKTWYSIKAKPMALQATEQQGKQPSGASAPAPQGNPLMMSLEAIGRGVIQAEPFVKAARPRRIRMAKDAQGNEHRGKGEGGGQFTSSGGGGEGQGEGAGEAKPEQGKTGERPGTPKQQSFLEDDAPKPEEQKKEPAPEDEWVEPWRNKKFDEMSGWEVKRAFAEKMKTDNLPKFRRESLNMAIRFPEIIEDDPKYLGLYFDPLDIDQWDEIADALKTARPDLSDKIDAALAIEDADWRPNRNKQTEPEKTSVQSNKLQGDNKVKGFAAPMTADEILNESKRQLGKKFAGAVVKTYGGGTQLEILQHKGSFHGDEVVRALTFKIPEEMVEDYKVWAKERKYGKPEPRKKPNA